MFLTEGKNHIIHLNHPEDFIWKPSKSKGFVKRGQIPGEENTNMTVKLPDSVNVSLITLRLKPQLIICISQSEAWLILYTAEQQSNAIKDKVLQLEEA